MLHQTLEPAALTGLTVAKLNGVLSLRTSEMDAALLAPEAVAMRNNSSVGQRYRVMLFCFHHQMYCGHSALEYV